MIVVCLTGLLAGIVSLAGLWLMGWPYALLLAALCASSTAALTGILIAVRRQKPRDGSVAGASRARQGKRIDGASALPEPHRQA